MDAVTTLRELWRRRRYVAAVCVIALLTAAAFTFSSHRYSVGVASVRILVDTPSSQVVQVSPKGSDTLGTRADLLASVMIDGTVKSDIANRAGLEPGQLVGVTDAATQPSAAGPAPVTKPAGPNAYILSTQVLTDSAGNELPIIEVDAQAPNSAAASRLANSAVTGLRAYLDSTAALQRIAEANRLQLIGLGSPQASSEVRGSSRAIGVVVAILVFVLGCGVILGAVALARGWRAASVREQSGEREAPSALHYDRYEQDQAAYEPDPVQAAPTPAVGDEEATVWDGVLGPDEPYFEERAEAPAKRSSKSSARAQPTKTPVESGLREVRSDAFLDRLHQVSNDASSRMPAARVMRPSDPIRRSAT